MAVGHLELLENGLRYVDEGPRVGLPASDYSRGKIVCFSKGSRRRLRGVMMRLFSTADQWSGTLTIPASEYDGQADWRKRWRRFVMRCKREKIPVIWRLELHKSLVPHVHLTAWGTETYMHDLRRHWMEIWGLVGHPDAERYAVKLAPIGSPAGWLAYCALHNQKNEIGREPWRGRVWGVVNRELLEDHREIYTFRNKHVEQRFRRLCNRRFQTEGRKVKLSPQSSWDQLGFRDRMWVKQVLRRLEEKTSERA